MTHFLTIAALGLGTGAAYTLIAQGIVVVYRGSGVLNFGQGAVAMTGGYIFYQFTVRDGWNFWPAFLLAVVVAPAPDTDQDTWLIAPSRRLVLW